MGRPKKLGKEEAWLQEEFKEGTRNSDVLRQQLAEKGVAVGIRTVERAVEKVRQEIRCAETATLRFETDPGQQLQIDFGEKWITVAEARVKVFVFVATLGYSRRTFARIYPGMRQQHWLEGLESALRHFGGATDECLVDNAKALVLEWKDDVPQYHPEFEAFCRHWGMSPRACRPYHARTKGKVENGVKYVKSNALGLYHVLGLGEEIQLAERADLARVDRWLLLVGKALQGPVLRQPGLADPVGQGRFLVVMPLRPSSRARNSSYDGCSWPASASSWSRISAIRPRCRFFSSCSRSSFTIVLLGCTVGAAGGIAQHEVVPGDVPEHHPVQPLQVEKAVFQGGPDRRQQRLARIVPHHGLQPPQHAQHAARMAAT
jgi:transposase